MSTATMTNYFPTDTPTTRNNHHHHHSFVNTTTNKASTKTSSATATPGVITRMNNNNNNSPSDHGYSIKGIEVSPPLTTKKMRKNSPQASSNNGGLRVNTSVDRFGQLARSPFIGVNAIDNGQLPQVTTPNSATIDIKHFEQLAIDLVDRDLTSPSVRPKNQQPLSSSSSEESFDGTAWLGTGPSTQFFPPSSFVSTPSPRSPVSSSGGDCEDEDEFTELERLRRENEELKRKLAAVSQIAIDTILNQPKLSEAGMTNDQIKQSRKEAVAAVAAACGISKSRAQKEAKRRWLEGKDKDELIHHYQVTTNNKTKRTIIGILKKRNEMDLVKELKKDLKSPKKQELDS